MSIFLLKFQYISIFPSAVTARLESLQFKNVTISIGISLLLISQWSDPIAEPPSAEASLGSKLLLFHCPCKSRAPKHGARCTDRRPKTEDRRPKTEDTEDRRDRRPETEDRRPTTEDRIRIHWNPLESIRIHWNPLESIGIHWNPLESIGIH